MNGARFTEEAMPDTGWMADAACVHHPGLPWTGSQRVSTRVINRMRGVCADCPVLADCARFAVDAKITAGWWAGVNLYRFSHAHPPTMNDMRGDAA